MLDRLVGIHTLMVADPATKPFAEFMEEKYNVALYLRFGSRPPSDRIYYTVRLEEDLFGPQVRVVRSLS